MGAAAIRVTEKKDEKERIDQQDIFYGVVSFLPAITRFLFNRVLGADDPPFGAVMGKSCYAESALEGRPRVTEKNEKILSSTLSHNLLKGTSHGSTTPLLYRRTY